MKPVTLSETADRKYWIKRYEFEGMEAEAKAVALAENGDIVIAGSIKPKEKDAKSSGLVARLDREGNVKWVRILVGSENDEFNDIKVAPNGDIVVVGYTESFGAGDADLWVLRLDKNGNIKWQKTYGGSNVDFANAVAIAENGDIILAGYTESLGANTYHAWVLRLDAYGEVKWQRVYARSHWEEANAVAIAPNGDIIIAGYTEGIGTEWENIWVLRLDRNGNIKWQKTYGGNGDDWAFSIATTSDDDIIVAGSTRSFGPGSSNIWVLRLDRNGNIKWQKTYGGKDWDEGTGAAVAPNGDIIVVGKTKSFNSSSTTESNSWILCLDKNGNVKWQKTCGGDKYDDALDVETFPNGDIIVVGHTESFGNNGGSIWMFKIPPNGNLSGCLLCQDSSAIVSDTSATIRDTKCKVKEVGNFLSEFRIMATDAAIRTITSKLDILCEWEAVKTSDSSISTSEFQEVELTKISNGILDSFVSALVYSSKPKIKKLKGLYDEIHLIYEESYYSLYQAKRKENGKDVNLMIFETPLEENLAKNITQGIHNWLKLRHPHVTQIYDIKTTPFPLLEIEGYWLTLGKVPKPLPIKNASKVIADIAEGLKHAHTHDILHGNLKPSLIAIKSGKAKISDWTLSNKKDKTMTLLYAAPEELDKSYGTIDRRTDIWHLGVIFYELVTGRSPFERDTPNDIVTAIISEKPQLPSKINPKAKKVEPIIMKMLEKEKTKRYQSIEELQRDLKRIFGEDLEKIKLTIPTLEDEEPYKESPRKPCPGYLINGRCYIAKASVMDEAGLKSALEELDKELSSIDFIQPLPNEITVHPLKGIIEGENLFVTQNIVSRGPGESGIIPSKWLIEILDWIRNTITPEIDVPEKVSRGLMAGEATLSVSPSANVRVEIKDVPYVHIESLTFPVKLTGDGGKALKNIATTDPGARKRLGNAVSKLLSHESVQELLSHLLDKYGEIARLNINFAPSTLEFNGFSGLLKEPKEGVHSWNINLGLGAVLFRPEKGNQVLFKEPLAPETVQDIKTAASELMELVELAKHQKTKLPSSRPISSMKTTPEQAPAVPTSAESLVEGFPSSLLSRYEPLEFLGEGGFARVYKVRRKKDGKIVALKIPRIDERTSGLFVKEVAAWYNLNHENIVRLYKADILPVPYLEMEFVEGAEIDGELFRDLGAYPKPVPERMAIKLITGIAEGLVHAHSKGIYHLDLKPLNVLLKADLTPKITDWGLAKISARSSLSRHYGYSPLYAAPEQLDEETFGVPDHRTDIYQLGLIFYELLTGELPYKATSPGALVGKILYAKPKPVSELKPELKKFDGIFEKLLAKRKEERYGSVEEFLSALKSLGELEREKEELRKTSLAMRKSRSREEFERLKVESIHKTVKIAILSAKLNDKAELLAALDDLKFYTHENLDDLLNAITQIEMLLKEGIPISPETEERIRALVLRIEGEALR